MAVVNTVSVNLERKFNLGDWQSYTVGVQMWAQVEPGEDPVEATQRLFADVRNHIKQQAEPIVRREVNMSLGNGLDKGTGKVSAANVKTKLDFQGKPVSEGNGSAESMHEMKAALGIE